jgi:hypothetical protein
MKMTAEAEGTAVSISGRVVGAVLVAYHHRCLALSGFDAALRKESHLREHCDQNDR